MNRVITDNLLAMVEGMKKIVSSGIFFLPSQEKFPDPVSRPILVNGYPVPTRTSIKN